MARVIGWFGLAALLVGGVALTPRPALAQEQGPSPICQGARPVVTTYQGGAGGTVRHRGRIVLIQDLFEADSRIRNARVTTTIVNFNGVEGVVAELTEDELGRTVSYSFPAWLLDAYRGNTGAIIADLESGNLKDRLSPASAGC